jgi:hypothetical protein
MPAMKAEPAIRERRLTPPPNPISRTRSEGHRSSCRTTKAFILALCQFMSSPTKWPNKPVGRESCRAINRVGFKCFPFVGRRVLLPTVLSFARTTAFRTSGDNLAKESGFEIQHAAANVTYHYLAWAGASHFAKRLTLSCFARRSAIQLEMACGTVLLACVITRASKRSSESMK